MPEMKYAIYDGYPCVYSEQRQQAWVRFKPGWTEILWIDAFTKAGMMTEEEYKRRWPQVGLPNA